MKNEESFSKIKKDESFSKIKKEDLDKIFTKRADGSRACSLGECTFTQENLHSGNLKRHVATKHKDVAAKLIEKAASEPEGSTPAKRQKQSLVNTVSVLTDRHTVLLGTIQLVTVNALPLSFPGMVGFKTLTDPLYKAFGITLNRNNLTTLVHRAAAIARDIIASETKHRLVSLKVDSATRGNRSFFGINAQYHLADRIVIRNLGNYCTLLIRLIYVSLV